MIAGASFADALLQPELAAPAGLLAPPGIDSSHRFAVHRNNIVVTLVDALAAAFPVTQALVGADFFRAMAGERVRLDPPRSPIVSQYGTGFAAFIADYAAAASLAYLPDIARLEYLRVQAYHAADVEPLDVARFHALLATPGRIAGTRVGLHPACGWLRSRYPVHSIWAAHQGLDDLADANLDAIDLATPENALVTRPQARVMVNPVPLEATAALERLRSGAALGSFCSDQATPEATASLEALLVLLIQHQLVVALDHLPE